ncbi:hypothetical protein LTR91_008564 [Friedmanniomyces endolithicus]|uniref:Uncharacterized protein n=1 Tax=Friedmanniomyces endolithicus TaxID=329885 RepID=A0AAN6KM76_9PEZI|nr:hypothetical protein LTR57_009353 [Friedmanniomyces endolithicus]KAK0987780.1 hypothetical protein LTS01_009451 [Friedmanniomyces endolithicus]KAK0991539.1 hypothetical protein LTR91_008564 [Friedmanniomyces endolithicus]KAK1039709.1 hypothetical protein LTS16_011002 [Friedmanniomyces endolithicus]
MMVTSIATSIHTRSVPFVNVEDEEPQPAYPIPGWSQTTLNYFRAVPAPDAAPDSPLSEHEQRVQRRTDDSPAIEKVAVRIRNIRGNGDDYSLETHGFKVGHLECHLQDWSSDDELRRVYFPEVIELLKRETGAKYVFQYEWHVRLTTLEDGLKQDSSGAVDIKGPVRRVHIDESPAAAILEYNYHIQPRAEHNKHLKGRPFGVYNVWKPLKTVRRDPLALCDCRSVANEDLHATKVCVPKMGEIENISLRAPKDGRKHDFVYVGSQRPDQALVFRIFDSRIDGVVDGKFSHGVAHSSFVDPGTEREAARESVEALLRYTYQTNP